MPLSVGPEVGRAGWLRQTPNGRAAAGRPGTGVAQGFDYRDGVTQAVGDVRFLQHAIVAKETDSRCTNRKRCRVPPDSSQAYVVIHATLIGFRQLRVARTLKQSHVSNGMSGFVRLAKVLHIRRIVSVSFQDSEGFRRRPGPASMYGQIVTSQLRRSSGGRFVFCAVPAG